MILLTANANATKRSTEAFEKLFILRLNVRLTNIHTTKPPARLRRLYCETARYQLPSFWTSSLALMQAVITYYLASISGATHSRMQMRAIDHTRVVNPLYK